MGPELPFTPVTARLLVLVPLLACCASPLRAEGSRFALVFGINSNPAFPQHATLQYADRDATEFARFLSTPEGGLFPTTNVMLRLNQDATRAGIFTAIRELGKRVGSEDTVYVFFAGHSVVDDLDFAYFMPYDATPTEPNVMGIRDDEFIKDIQRRLNAKHLIFFIDACYAAAAYSNGLARTAPQNISAHFIRASQELFTNQPGTSFAFLSASSNQRSWEDHALKHGIFTYYLIQGMGGQADTPPNGDADGKVTAGELLRFLVDKVSSHSKTKFTEQTPVASPSFAPAFPLSLMAWRLAVADDKSSARANSSIVIKLIPTQNSQLLNDPSMKAIRAELVKLGYTVTGWPSDAGYTLRTPNNSTLQWFPSCGAGITYFDPQLKLRAIEIQNIVRRYSSIGEVHFQDLETLPNSGTRLWLKDIVRRGEVHIEVCFGIP